MALSGAACTRAATYDQAALWDLTTTKQNFAFKQFDPTWGVLLSATLTISLGEPRGFINITTKRFSASIREIRSKVQIVSEGITSYDGTQVSLTTSIPLTYFQVSNTSVDYVISGNQRLLDVPQVLDVSSLALANYTGSGQTPSIAANVWAYISKTPDIYTTISTASYNAPTSFKLSYDYLPASVPEPSTYGHLLGWVAIAYVYFRKYFLSTFISG